MQDGQASKKRDADQLQTWTLEDIWGPSSMQVVDRTIAGRLHVQLDRVIGQAELVDPPGDDSDMVAEMGGHGASKGDAVVKHHMRVVHDDVGCGVRLLNGCKESKHETKECKINQLDPEKNGRLVQESLKIRSYPTQGADTMDLAVSLNIFPFACNPVLDG